MSAGRYLTSVRSPGDPRCLLCTTGDVRCIAQASTSTCTQRVERDTVFQSSQLPAHGLTPPHPPPNPLKASSAPRYCVGCSAQCDWSRAPRLARKEAVARAALAEASRVAAVWAPRGQRRLCITEVPSTASLSSSVAPECILKLASAAKMTWAPGACSCASGATIRLLRVARKWLLVLRLCRRIKS